MIILFFIAWIADSLSLFIFGYSTVILDVITVPALLAVSILFLFFSYYLISKSHKAVLNQVHDPPQIDNKGVYAWIRHPMYLGILLFCLSFLFLSLSLIAAGIWILFYFIYDKMATYEEKKLIEILGEEYRLYQKKVPKWLPKIE